jgi:glycosyltransferase involved in cell wall biosynthesis
VSKKDFKYKDIWIFYDFLLSHGGAEYTTALLQNELGCKICTGFVEEGNLLHLDKKIIKTISKKRTFPGFATLDGLWSFWRRTKFLQSHQHPVLFSGSNAVVAVHNHPHGKNVLYCHTIPRFAYDMRSYYRGSLPSYQKGLFDLLCCLTAFSYQRAINKMDIILVNSKNVQKRLKKYLGLPSEIVYPPVETNTFNYIRDDGYYLSTSRLEDYKRVDIIIKAFLGMPDKQLVVSSSGRQEASLKALAKNASNIHFTGWVSGSKLRTLVGKARATIYMPIDEDFGISPVESMAAGKPVIGANEGGVLETVLHQQTGYLCSATPDAIKKAVNWLTSERALSMKETCERRAALFDKSIFIETIKSYLI